MAVTPQTNQAFLREVDDELRRDQLVSVWERFGRWIIAGIVAALALFAGILWWQHHREVVAGEEGERLQQAYDALGAQQPAKAGPILADLAQSHRDGYRALALFTQADLLLQKNDLKGAAAKFGAIASDTGLASPFRDLALIRQTSAEFDTIKPAVVVERLRPLAAKGSPWLGSAGELVAIAYIREGRTDLAGTLFGQIAADPNVPPTLRQRAVQMAGTMASPAASDAAQSSQKVSQR